MNRLLACSWRGEIPLARAFWELTVLYGTVANLVTTIAAMTAVTLDLPNVVALTIFLLPIPYNVLMVAAVWRSASRYPGRPLWADLARAAVILWALAASMLSAANARRGTWWQCRATLPARVKKQSSAVRRPA